MAGLLTPLQLQVGASLFQNQGFQESSSLTNSISSYESTQPISTFLSVITSGSGVLSTTTLASLQTLASNTCPALADSVPQAFITNPAYPVTTTFPVATMSVTDPGLTGILTGTTGLYLGNGDISKFTQLFSLAQGYCQSTNVFINSAVNAETYLQDTFTTMNDLITGDLTQVNLDTQAFGADLAKLGNLINLGNVRALGYPLTLIQQVVQQGGLISPLTVALTLAGVNETVILSLTDPSLRVDDSVQKAMYDAMTLIQGNDLQQILNILKVTTTGIENMADLLNPVKILPNSFSTLTAPTCSGPRGIYLDNQGTVNSKLTSELPSAEIVNYERLRRIVPSDLALTNAALSSSLRQITNILNITLAQLSQAYLGVETTKDLPDISAQLSPVPGGDVTYYKDTYATGTGENGTILIVDVIGTPSGATSVQQLNNSVEVINSLDSLGALNSLENIYTIMLDIVTGTYGDPSVGPITGLPAGPWTAGQPYANADVAIATGMIPAAQSELANIVSSYPTQTTALNDSFTAIGNQLDLEKQQQALAGINFADFTANLQSSIQMFVFSLPNYGLETKQGGTAQYLEDLADLSVAGGQAIVACMRDGRNRQVLADSGVVTANIVDDTPAPSPQAPLIPSEYSPSEAKNQIIT